MKSLVKNSLAVAAVLGVLALIPATSPAYMGEEGPPQPGKHFNSMVKDLQLTAQQKQQVKEILAKNRPQSEPLMKQFTTERRAMRTLIQADSFDEAAIRAQSAKMVSLEADLAVQRARIAQEIRAVLTPEQIAKAKELQAQRDKKMDERFMRHGKRQRQAQ